MDTAPQPDALWHLFVRDTAAPPSPPALLVRAWTQAVQRARLDLAATHRLRLETYAHEEPTWEDAEWQ